MEKYLLHGKLTATEGNAQKLSQLLTEASRLVSGAQGYQLYVVSVNEQDKNSVWVTEIWDTKADHDNSLNVAGVKELISQAIPILNDPPEKGQELTIVGGF